MPSGKSTDFKLMICCCCFSHSQRQTRSLLQYSSLLLSLALLPRATLAQYCGLLTTPFVSPLRIYIYIVPPFFPPFFEILLKNTIKLFFPRRSHINTYIYGPLCMYMYRYLAKSKPTTKKIAFRFKKKKTAFLKAGQTFNDAHHSHFFFSLPLIVSLTNYFLFRFSPSLLRTYATPSFPFCIYSGKKRLLPAASTYSRLPLAQLFFCLFFSSPLLLYLFIIIFIPG